jgi:hypothetical protein
VNVCLCSASHCKGGAGWMSPSNAPRWTGRGGLGASDQGVGGCVRYPQTRQIILVMDNLNTHTPASLYEAFESAEARRLAEKLQIHYTPKSMAVGSTWPRSSSACSADTMPRSTSAGLGKPPSGGRSLAGAARRDWHQDRLALHYGGCTHQAQATVPFISRVTVH